MSTFEQRREALRTALGISDHKSIIDIGTELARRGVVHLTPRRPNTANPAESHYPEATSPWPEFQNRGPDWEQWNKWYQYDWNHRPQPKPEPV